MRQHLLDSVVRKYMQRHASEFRTRTAARRMSDTHLYDNAKSKAEINAEFEKAFRARWASGTSWLGKPWKNPITKKVEDRTPWAKEGSKELAHLRKFDFASYIIGAVKGYVAKIPDAPKDATFADLFNLILDKWIGTQTHGVRHYLTSGRGADLFKELGITYDKFKGMGPKQIEGLQEQANELIEKLRAREEELKRTSPSSPELKSIQSKLTVLEVPMRTLKDGAPNTEVYDFIDQWAPQLEPGQWGKQCERNATYELKTQGAKVLKYLHREGTGFSSSDEEGDTEHPGSISEERYRGGKGSKKKGGVPEPYLVSTKRSALTEKEILQSQLAKPDLTPEVRAGLEKRLSAIESTLGTLDKQLMQSTLEGEPGSLTVADLGKFARKYREARPFLRSIYVYLRRGVVGRKGRGAPHKATQWPLIFENHPVTQLKYALLGELLSRQKYEGRVDSLTRELIKETDDAKAERIREQLVSIYGQMDQFRVSITDASDYEAAGRSLNELPGLHTLADLFVFMTNPRAISRMEGVIPKGKLAELIPQKSRQVAAPTADRSMMVQYLAHMAGVSSNQIYQLIRFDLLPSLLKWSVENRHPELFNAFQAEYQVGPLKGQKMLEWSPHDDQKAEFAKLIEENKGKPWTKRGPHDED